MYQLLICTNDSEAHVFEIKEAGDNAAAMSFCLVSAGGNENILKLTVKSSAEKPDTCKRITLFTWHMFPILDSKRKFTSQNNSLHPSPETTVLYCFTTLARLLGPCFTGRFVSLLSMSTGQRKQQFKGDTQAGALHEGSFDRPCSCLQDPGVGCEDGAGWAKEDSQSRGGDGKGGAVFRQYLYFI